MIDGKLADAISDINQEQSVLFKEKINYKQPGGGGFPPHQDAPAYTTFAQTLHVSCMVNCDPMTKENGCLDVVRGEHDKGTLKQDVDGSIHPDLVKTYNWEAMECPSGTVMIFGSYTPHRSGKNVSDKPRRAFYLTFNAISDGGSLRDGYYADKREKFPPEIERIPGKDYSEGGKIYNLATPITNKKEATEA
eukprot:Nk52_evm29s62 gene=Nk52_evmTU29s62